MSTIKKIFIICIVITIILPTISGVYAHSVELDTDNLISFPFMIWNGSGTITIDSSISNYSLYYQAVQIPDEDYSKIKNAESTGKEELNTIKEAYEAMRTSLNELRDTYDEASNAYREKLNDDTVSEATLESLRTAYETAKTNYESKMTEYNNKVNEYNAKVDEINERVKDLTPSYNDQNWTKSNENEFEIDRTQFTGNLAHVVWAKLVTSDNKTYYDEAIYTIEGTKETGTQTKETNETKKMVKTRLDVIKQASETKYLENDQGYISKTIVDSDPDTGEVTIELKLSNTAQEVEMTKDTEIFLVVDNSGSMGYTTSTGEIRRDIIVRAMKNLVNNIYDISSNVKVGLIRFAGTGELLTNSTALMCDLTDNKQTMLNTIEDFENLDTSVTIDNQEMLHCESGTNIEAGLKKANDNFSSEDKNKIIILLTDGIPNYSLSNNFSNDGIYNATKSRLKSIGDSGVSVISLMTGVTSSDSDAASVNAAEVVQQIFGTESNPTTGKFYNIADANLENVVTNDILADVMDKIQNPISNVKIVDYFPKDITDNFDFSYVGTPSFGTASDNIDTENKTITWDIGTLKGNEEATLKYKLKIKDMQNEELLNKTIATNEKVVLTYKDLEDKDYTVTLTSSPKIQLTEVKEDESEKNNSGAVDTNDPTIAPNKTLPNTGLSIAIIGSVLLVVISGVSLLAKYKTFKDVK